MNLLQIDNHIATVKSLLPCNGPVNINQVCSELGLEVICKDNLKKDGYLYCEGGVRLIFIKGDIKNRHRRKFIITHELGHFMIHSDQLIQGCSKIAEDFDRYEVISRQEYEANYFASELLLPQNELKRYLPNENITFAKISEIASKFDVSVTATSIKCIETSKTENELLLCYKNRSLSWFACADKDVTRKILPETCPIGSAAYNMVPTTRTVKTLDGVWDLFDGDVHEEVFKPTPNTALVLLCGKRKDSDQYDFS